MPTGPCNDEGDAATVDIWLISLRPGELTESMAESLLSTEERQRAARFRFPKHALRYRLCHAAMRQILGRYLQLSADRVELIYESKGKPRLSGNSTLCFNLSHSGDLALVAVTSGLEVGVDVETVRSDVQVDDLARFFTAAERDRLLALSPGEKERMFFRWWTRKEAVLKAEGSGLSGGLDRLDISSCPPDSVRFPDDGRQWWRVEDLEVEPGYAGAVAAPPGKWQVRWRS